jgi:hypothetical protein
MHATIEVTIEVKQHPDFDSYELTYTTVQTIPNDLETTFDFIQRIKHLAKRHGERNGGKVIKIHKVQITIADL